MATLDGTYNLLKHDYFRDKSLDIPKVVGLRRNSISLPALNVEDMEALRQAHMDHAANQVGHKFYRFSFKVHCWIKNAHSIAVTYLIRDRTG